MPADRFWAECDNYFSINGRSYTCEGSRVYNLPDGVYPYMIRSIITDQNTKGPVLMTYNKAYPLTPATNQRTTTNN